MGEKAGGEGGGVGGDLSGTEEVEKVYDEVDKVVRDLEVRQKPNFITDGTNFDIDVSPEDKAALESLFDMPPDIFTRCLLIRDYARPLRVGSALMTTTSSVSGFKGKKKLISD